MLRRVGRGTWLAGLLFLTAAPFAAAQTDDTGAPGADLVEKAQERFAIGDISGPDGEGRYHLPKASSEDVRAAQRLLEQAATAGDSEAHRLLGQMAEAGAGGPQDFTGARQHYTLAGENRIAYWRRGRLLLNGKGGAVDLFLARRLFRLAGDRGLIDASYELARMTELGLGGARDEAAARALYQRISEWCHGDMADRYSIMLSRGIGGPVDRAAAAAFQVKAFRCHNSNFGVPSALSRPDLFDRETIVEIQKRLRQSGYDGPLDGSFNAATKAALKGLITA